MSHVNRHSGRSFIPYQIKLEGGDFARLVLPHDLSQIEADRICGVIQALAFSDEELAPARPGTVTP